MPSEGWIRLTSQLREPVIGSRPLCNGAHRGLYEGGHYQEGSFGTDLSRHEPPPGNLLRELLLVTAIPGAHNRVGQGTEVSLEGSHTSRR